MNEVLAWCLENWKILVYFLCTLVIFLCTVLPKKVKVQDTVKEVILSALPRLINMVEVPGQGKAKLEAVVDMSIAAINKVFPGINGNQYRSFIKQSVEAILETPQKKG